MSKEKSDFDLRFDAIDEMCAQIPPGKFALVGVDDFDPDPEDELYLIRIFDTREAAEAALAARLAGQPKGEEPETLYIYEHEVPGEGA